MTEINRYPDKTIRLTYEVHAKLNEHGKRGETFSDIIRRLIVDYERNNMPDERE